MHCRFLEISVASEDLLASLEYYRALGFEELAVNDVWEHAYAAVSDGRISIGLHARYDASPALSFVLPELADTLATQSPWGLMQVYSQTGDEQFHQAAFTDPGGHSVMLLEARTFSPPDFADDETSLLGYFEGYALPCSDLDAGIACWESLGFVALERHQQPYRHATLTSEGLNLLLREDVRLREPVLVFSGDDLEARVALLKHRRFEILLEPEHGEDRDSGALLRTPENLLIQLIAAGD